MILFNLKKKEREEGKKRVEKGRGWGGEKEEKRREKARDRQGRLS